MQSTNSLTRVPFWAKLQVNLVAYLVALAVIPIAFVLLVSIPENIQQDKAEVFNRLETASELKASQIEAWLDAGHTGLDLILADPKNSELFVDVNTAPTDVNTSNTSDLLGRLVQSQDNYREILIYDLDGEILAASNTVEIGKNIRRQPYFAPSLDTTHYVQPPIYQVGTQDLAVFVTQPLVDGSGNVVGAIAASLEIDTLTNIMQESSGFPESGETYLISSQNRYFLTPSRFKEYEPNRAYTSTGIDTVLDQRDGNGIYQDYRDISVLGVYKWVPELEAGLLAEVDETDATASSIQVRNNTILVAVLAVVVAVATGFFYSLYVTRPLLSLTRASFAVTQGDYSQSVDIKRRNEIGQLGNAFNSMTAELQRNIEQLESRVASRTRDLQVASQVSRQVTRVLDRQHLLNEFVNSTKASFDLYHVSVFTYNEDTEQLILEAGAGSVGEAMLALGKQFNLAEQGLVPLAGRQKRSVVIGDVTAEASYFANPLLPETHTEVAIPMTIGDSLIGVLDLQATEINRFSADDLDVMQTLAEQIAIAIRNAQLYQEAQEARDEAERANSVKSSFLAAVSHELRTPLNAIINFSSFILKGRMGPTTPKQEESLQIVVDSGKHLLNLINDVLDISKIESGSLELFVEENIDLGKELKTALDAGQTLLEEKPVELRVQVDESLPTVMGDRQRILQVFLNVVSNACKFTETGSITVSAKQSAEEILISIKDTGPGIDPEEHAAVFESFRQTETGLRQGGGTGLGMPISMKLVEAHGGRLWLESQKGEGATFHIALPVHSPVLKPSLS